MPTYTVSINCIENYQEREIEAQNEWEAEEKYQAMLESGDVLVVNSHFIDLQVNKVQQMTKKDPELIAEELKHVKAFVDKFANEEYNKGKYDTWYTVVIRLSSALEKESPHFNKEKFLQACGLLPQG